jgi:hypothetical protein
LHDAAIGLHKIGAEVRAEVEGGVARADERSGGAERDVDVLRERLLDRIVAVAAGVEIVAAAIE